MRIIYFLFLEFMEEVPDKNADIILICQPGGNLEPSGQSRFGK